MTTELFLGGLAILTMAAVVIVALTNGRRDESQQSSGVYDMMRAEDSRNRMRRDKS